MINDFFFCFLLDNCGCMKTDRLIVMCRDWTDRIHLCFYSRGNLNLYNIVLFGVVSRNNWHHHFFHHLIHFRELIYSSFWIPYLIIMYYSFTSKHTKYYVVFLILRDLEVFVSWTIGSLRFLFIINTSW